ncbi:MAG: hypothetical protein J7K14_00585 [Sulfurimonas sp.]|nr:hypothetical protein [Sulfurimonas sp.]
MYSYTYNSNIGTFEIKQVGRGRYELWIEYELIGSYESAESAAEDVSNFNTGYNEWDKFHNDIQDFPPNISKWALVKEESPQ